MAGDKPTATKQEFVGQVGLEVRVPVFGADGKFEGRCAVAVEQSVGGADLWQVVIVGGPGSFYLSHLDSDGLKKIQDLIGAALRAGVKAGVVG